jgi:hypothetical protein
MSKILKTLQQLCRDVEDNNQPSAYGTRFVHDFYVVVANLHNGAPLERPSKNWAFKECSFADKRANTFVFRTKFLKRMTQFDKRVMDFVTNEIYNLTRAELTAPTNTTEERLLIDTVNVCRVIQGLGAA